jgi:hypothetical protein
MPIIRLEKELGLLPIHNDTTLSVVRGRLSGTAEEGAEGLRSSPSSVGVTAVEMKSVSTINPLDVISKVTVEKGEGKL